MTVVNFSSLEEQLATASAQVAADQGQLTQLLRTVQDLHRQLAAAKRPKRVAGEPAEVDEDLIASLTAQIAADDKTVTQLQARVRAGQTQADQVRQVLARALIDPLKGIELLSMTSPIALLPVRLETRFVKTAAGGTELWVRFYPDDLQIDGHDPGLSDDELAWGTHFAKLSVGTPGEAAKRQAWADLVRHFGPRRAAWIAAQVAPLNPDGTLGRAQAIGKRTGRGPQATLLPDHWVVIGYQDGKRSFIAWGNSIHPPLLVGPLPAPGAPAPTGDGVNRGTRWMIDFDEAVAVGMALRVPLVGSQVNGLDRLLALGVSVGGDAAGSTDAGRLATALTAHHYLNGLQFVVQATPTNNSDAGRAGHTSAVPDPADSFALERGPSRVIAQPSSDQAPPSDGLALARALGIDPQTFGHVAGADGGEQAMAQTMKLALWPATWGYYFQNLMNDVLTAADAELAHQHFAEHVWAGGPLPTLKVGDMPYGVLPVSTLSLWKPGRGQEDRIDAPLAAFLNRVREIWRRAIPRVPRVGAHPADPDGDLIALLGMDGVSSRYDAQAVVLRHLIRALHGLLVGNVTMPAAIQTPSLAPLRSLGIRATPRLGLAAYAPDTRPVPGPLVIDRGQTELTYLAALAKQLRTPKAYEAIWNQPPPSSPAPLLYRLLRYAVLREFATAAFEVLRTGTSYPPEPELIDLLVPSPHLPIPRRRVTRRGTIPEEWWTSEDVPELGDPPETETDWRRLHRTRPGGADTVGDYLTGQVAQYVSGKLRLEAVDRPAQRLCRMHDYLEGLANVRAPAQASREAPDSFHRLERLMCSTLDLAAHRLDAWITSLPAKRLQAMRTKQATGLHLGGYAWVENLKPAAPVESEGYVHAPTIDHAAMAAVLRSGYLAHASNGRPNPLQIDLSSARARSALELTEGVRSGQRLAELLGYRFERALLEAHERQPGLGLASLLYPIRQLRPLKAGKLTPVASDAAKTDFNVVDGLALLQSGIDWNSERFKAVEASAREVVNGIVRGLQDSLHALSDATTAEAVFQLVRGNVMRAGAAVDAMSRGEGRPPELEVLNSVRSGIALTHRLVIFVDAPPSSSTWPGRSLRALAEPRLNAWIGALLGDPANVVCGVRYVARKTGEPAGAGTVTVRQLHLSPLDLLALVSGRGQPQATELDQRLIDAAERLDTAPRDSSAVLDYRPTALAAGQITFGDFLELAHALRDLLFGAQALQARDLTWGPSAAVSPRVDVAELERRWSAVQQALRGVKDATTGSPAANLRAAAELGIAGAVPASEDPVAQLAQADRIRADVAQRLKAADAAIDAAQPGDGPRDALRAALGNELPILPPFALDTSSADLVSAFAASNALLQRRPGEPSDEQAPIRWMQEVARVRPAVGRLERAALYSELLGRLNLKLEVAQLPYQPGDRWLALKTADEKAADSGRVAVVALKPATIAPQSVAGLLIDQWVEMVPGARETTAVAFHYDALTAQAPQAVLLAVPPDPDPTHAWSLEMLETVLLETLDLAKLRAVDETVLDEVSQFLPALCLAHNPRREDAISEDLT